MRAAWARRPDLLTAEGLSAAFRPAREEEPHELSDASAALAENRLEAAEATLRRRLQRAPHDEVARRGVILLPSAPRKIVRPTQDASMCLRRRLPISANCKTAAGAKRTVIVDERE